MGKQGLFAGLITLDFLYLTTKLPRENEKVVAQDYLVTAGGPATNAALTFAHLGNEAELLGVLGRHPTARLIRHDLLRPGLTLHDLSPHSEHCPPVSSVITLAETGERSVVSINAMQRSAPVPDYLACLLDDVAVVLLDGHQIALGAALAQMAQARNIPVVLDGGSWKPGLEKILPHVTYALCSDAFIPPNCDPAAVLAYLQHWCIPYGAITRGGDPLDYYAPQDRGQIVISGTKVVDTLGAGDIFHGAFCHYFLDEDFPTALRKAAALASHSCSFFGPRQWMESPNFSWDNAAKRP